MGNNRKLGAEGETIAVKYLQNKGYTVLKRNYASRLGEVDIIAEDGEYIVFVEVKYRRSLNTGYPAEAVTAAKQRKIRAVATQYLMSVSKTDELCRFDVIQLLETDSKLKINHICNAF